MSNKLSPVLRSIVSLTLAAAAACSDPAGAGGPADLSSGNRDGGSAADGGGDPVYGVAAGSVQAIEVRTPYGTVDELTAAFYAEEPSGFHREAQRIGSCRRLTFQPAQCDLFCMGICVERNVCKPYPTRLSAGALSFSGLKQKVTLQPQYQNAYYADPPLTADLFDAGDAVEAVAAGADFAAFRLTAAGVAALETASVVNDEIKLADSADYTFTWTPSGDPRARLRLTLNANNRGHGAPYQGIIECDAPDTGSLTIAKELIMPFPDTYRWEICAGSDCPLSSALRYIQSEGQAGARRVTFTVGSRRSFWVLHRPPI